ncbi:MAG: QacE family quaternary ammonium compound efflux SMR transporter [Pelagibacteraceae bacterium]|nr:QacE family quaternary ammonium compound efflux SMR transporter [Pelagibacteraceae bacterium]
MSIMIAYMYLFFAVIFGTASNLFAKSAEGFSKLTPSIFSIITIILCMYCLSQVMKSIPVGITYAIFAGLCIVATVLIGIIKFNQIPNIYSFVGLAMIVSGVIIVNLLDKN